MGITPCTMMKPHFQGKTTCTKPIYSRKLIHPSCIVKHGACGMENTIQCPVCGIIVQVSYTMVSKVYGLYSLRGIVEFLGLRPWNSTLRVQYPYTLENHSTTRQCMYNIVSISGA